MFHLEFSVKTVTLNMLCAHRRGGGVNLDGDGFSLNRLVRKAFTTAFWREVIGITGKEQIDGNKLSYLPYHFFTLLNELEI